jgi:hypothetical protein
MIMKKSVLIFLFLIGAVASQAQNIRIADSRDFLYSDFFVAIVAGVLLALIFQIVLTALSVAMGITMIGNVKKKYARNKAKLDSARGSNEFTLADGDDEEEGLSGVKFSSAFGIWSLITTAISLFGACALALNLSFFGTLASNLTIALVIWALFFMILFYLETKIVHTLIGGLVTTATAGLKSSAGIVKDLFKIAPSNKKESVIEKTMDKVRRDFDVNLSTDKITRILDDFLEEMEQEELNFEDLKADLTKVIDNPKESLSIIKSRINKLDEGAIKDLVTNNRFINENDIEKITSEINEAVENVKVKIDKIERKVFEQIELAKRKVVIQAEHARKTAASAAWWLVLTVVFSGGAAMLGAYLELLK